MMEQNAYLGGERLTYLLPMTNRILFTSIVSLLLKENPSETSQAAAVAKFFYPDRAFQVAGRTVY